MTEQKNAIPVRLLNRIQALLYALMDERNLPLAYRHEAGGCRGSLTAWMDNDEDAISIPMGSAAAAAELLDELRSRS